MKNSKTTKTMSKSRTTSKKSAKTATSQGNQCAKTVARRKPRTPMNTVTCNKQWLSSKKVRPKTVVIVAERTQEGYRIKSATVRVAVNQHAKTAVPITDLGMFVNDIKQKGFRS